MRLTAQAALDRRVQGFLIVSQLAVLNLANILEFQKTDSELMVQGSTLGAIGEISISLNVFFYYFVLHNSMSFILALTIILLHCAGHIHRLQDGTRHLIDMRPYRDPESPEEEPEVDIERCPCGISGCGLGFPEIEERSLDDLQRRAEPVINATKAISETPTKTLGRRARETYTISPALCTTVTLAFIINPFPRFGDFERNWNNHAQGAVLVLRDIQFYNIPGANLCFWRRWNYDPAQPGPSSPVDNTPAEYHVVSVWQSCQRLCEKQNWYSF